MQQGKIKWFNPEKGFGFIVPDSGCGDVFLHISIVEEAGLDMLEPGQKVLFESVLREDKGGKYYASHIELV